MNNSLLQTNRIDIWQFSLASQPAQAFGLLNDDEKTRARRYHFERHQRQFIVARAMMRSILAPYLGAKPEELIFNFNKQGKPAIQHPENIHFNLSHSGELALLAVGQEYPMGIDLEFFSARPYVDIGAQLFSEREMQELRQLPPDLQALGFFHIWAQKEAFIKASGLGLSYPTREFSVPSLPTTNELIQDNLHQRTWKMVSYMPSVVCCAAICHDPAVTCLHKITVDPGLWLGRDMI